MAKRRVHINLIMTNEAAAPGIITSIEARLGILDIFNQDGPPEKDFESEEFRGIGAKVRFNTITDANNFSSFTQGLFANPDVLAGSRIGVHTCLHDEPEANWVRCVEDQVFVK